MGRTPLARWIAREAARAEFSEEHEGTLTRRELLRRAGAIGAVATGAATFGRMLPAANAAVGPRIVVVGAGLAGLTCAFRLKQGGHLAEVHEAADRVGGRCWTLRGAFADGQLGEHGGEFIDTGHREIRRLIRELGLSTVDVNAAEAPGTEPFFYFDGKRYPLAKATEDIQNVWPIWRDDTKRAGYPTTYDSFTTRGKELDQTPLSNYLHQTIPGGRASKLAQLLDVAYTIEYGAETNDQSTLNFLYLIGFTKQTELALFGESDERFRIDGGNDLLPARLVDQLTGQISFGSELVAINENPGGGYSLTFDQGATTKTVKADKVVLALPFSILRRTVDITHANFKPRKRRAIDEQGMATNSKLHVQFRNRYWESLACNGETYAATGYQNTWEVSRAQAGNAGLLVDYTGGNIGASFGTGTAEQRARQFLEQIEPVLPGISDRWNGRATVDFWKGYRWTRGSYSYWKVGQYTDFAGVEREREGNCHFAGEHTSIDAQGYLNGAVETGERAAAEVLADL